MRRLLCTLIVAISLLGNLLAPVSNAQTKSRAQTSSSSQSTTGHDAQEDAKCNDNGAYLNSQGQKVKRPENCSGPPAKATAQCRDGAYSFSRNHRGTCSHHGGVAKWF
jgi:hypothetical protein